MNANLPGEMVLSREYDALAPGEKTVLGLSLLDEAVRKGACDLHLHTQASDGADSPARVVQRAMENRLRCFSITDHDSIEGVQDALRVLSKLSSIGMTCPGFIPGVELSVQEEREVHILGYFPLGGYEKMESFILTQRKRRNDRNIELCRLLTAHGMPISIEELRAEGGSVVGRLHAANVLTRKGYIGSSKEAFSDWIGYGKPCYAPRVKPSAKEAIGCILAAGGVPVVAHPYIYEWTSGTGSVSTLLLRRLSELKSDGLLGVEAFHGEADFAEKIETEAAANTLDLICTAGSDCHGDNKPGVSMYDGSARFYHENDVACVAGILEREGKIFAVRKTVGLIGDAWTLPGGRKMPGKSGEESLIEILKESLCIDASIEGHYATVVQDTPAQRTTLIVYRCAWNGLPHANARNLPADSYGFFRLGELSGMDLMQPDAAVIDRLREMSFL